MQTVVVGLTGGSYNDPVRLKELLDDVYFLASIGARPVIVHGGKQSHSEYLDSDVDVADEIAVELNEGLARQYETIGGRAMTLNFDSGPVLGGIRESENALGSIQSVDRIVIDNLCYAGQTPIIPTMCAGTSGEKILVDDFCAIPKVASSLSAKAAIIVVDGLRSERQVIPTTALSESAASLGISELVTESIISAVESGLETVHLIDCEHSHGMLLQLFTEHRTGVEIRKVN